MTATEEQINHILGLLKKDNICYCCSVHYDDRIYIDGDVTFDTMAEIVDYLREQNKTD